MESCFDSDLEPTDVKWSNEREIVRRTCSSCEGRGTIERTCEQCEGRGCAWCRGTGKGVYVCPSCDGRGYKRAKKMD